MSTVHRNSVSGASLSKSVAPSSARARSSTVTSNPLGRSVASTSATPLRQSHLPSANGRAAPKPTIARRDTLLTPASGRQPTSESLGRPQGGSTGQKHDKMQYGKLDNPPRRLAKDTEPRRRHDSPTPPSRVQASTAINGRQHGSSTMQAPGPALKVDLHDASAVTSQAQAQSGAPVPALTSQADGHEPEEVTYVVAHITVPQPNKPQPEETIPGPLPPWLIQSLSATLSATEVGTYQPGLAHLAQLMEEFACSDELMKVIYAAYIRGCAAVDSIKHARLASIERNLDVNYPEYCSVNFISIPASRDARGLFVHFAGIAIGELCGSGTQHGSKVVADEASVHSFRVRPRGWLNVHGGKNDDHLDYTFSAALLLAISVQLQSVIQHEGPAISPERAALLYQACRSKQDAESDRIERTIMAFASRTASMVCKLVEERVLAFVIGTVGEAHTSTRPPVLRPSTDMLLDLATTSFMHFGENATKSDVQYLGRWFRVLADMYGPVDGYSSANDDHRHFHQLAGITDKWLDQWNREHQYWKKKVVSITKKACREGLEVVQALRDSA